MIIFQLKSFTTGLVSDEDSVTLGFLTWLSMLLELHVCGYRCCLPCWVTSPASSVIGSVMDNWTLLITINFMMTNKSRSMIITSTTSCLRTSGDTTHHATSQDQHHDFHKKNNPCSSLQQVFGQLNLKTWKECVSLSLV